MSRLLVVASVVLLAAGSAQAAKPAKPKPWMWTTAVAARQISSLDLSPLNDVLGTTTIKRCAGKGKRVGKSYAAFACSASFAARGPSATPQTLTLWVKVRRVGKGEPCVWTSPAVPAACTNPRGARLRGDDSDATAALVKKISTGSIPFQGPTGCSAWGVGYFRCWFGANAANDPSNGWATVVLLRAGAVVTVTKEFVKPA